MATVNGLMVRSTMDNGAMGSCTDGAAMNLPMERNMMDPTRMIDVMDSVLWIFQTAINIREIGRMENFTNEVSIHLPTEKNASAFSKMESV